MNSPWLAQVSDPAADALNVANPYVLGPIAAFVFIIFVAEIIVSGQAYRRELAETQRLRLLVEAVVPLADQMVIISKQMANAAEESNLTLRENTAFLEELSGKRAPRP